MCGIAGKVGNGSIEPSAIAAMCDTLVHRGPDSRGIFADANVGLGVQRLAIIDLATGDQPIFNEDGTIVLVLNGEIYNYRELRTELERSGHRFSTATDTEVIVHLYEEFGADCVQRLRGMFAFALWDRGQERLLLARDRVGKKPLFYAERDGALWFASEAKAILQDESIPRDVNLDAVASFLHLQYVPEPMSAFAALKKLPAGHVLSWHEGQASIRRYWKLSYHPDLALTEDEAAERVRNGLLEATRLRLRSDVPVGALLSGGIDSSAVVAAMAQVGGGTIRTFSIGFREPQYDETHYAREVADLFCTDHEEFVVEPDALAIMPRLVRAYGEPFADPSAIPSFLLAEMTRRHVTVALNGDGGDESFAGYRRYQAMLIAELLHRAPRSVSQRLAALSGRLGTGGRQGSVRHRASRLARASALDTVDRYAMWVAFFAQAERAALFTPELRDELRSYDTAAPLRAAYLASDACSLLDRLLDVDVQTYLVGALLVKMDIASMSHSLEVRSPFLDHELMETAARLPARMKLHHGGSKRILKRAVTPWLPHRIVNRPKKGFRVPLADWFRNELRSTPDDILLDPHSLDRGWFRKEEVRRLIEEHRNGAADHAERLWALIQLELWLREFIDVRPRTAVGSS